MVFFYLTLQNYIWFFLHVPCVYGYNLKKTIVFNTIKKTVKFYLFHVIKKLNEVAVIERLRMFKVGNIFRRPMMVDNICPTTFAPSPLKYIKY